METSLKNYEENYRGYIIEIRPKDIGFILVVDAIHYQSEDDRKLKTLNTEAEIISEARRLVDSIYF